MPTPILQSAIAIVEAGQNLSMEQMAETMGQIMDGGCDEAGDCPAATSLHDKGESVEEVAGAAAAMRERMTPIRSKRRDLIDTCGTGGDGSKTFNISTAAALVTAAAACRWPSTETAASPAAAARPTCSLPWASTSRPMRQGSRRVWTNWASASVLPRCCIRP